MYEHKSIVVKSIDGSIIYTIQSFPFAGRVEAGKMKSKPTCKECDFYAFTWDKLASDYMPYCTLFDVWQEGSKPNIICNNSIRNRA